MTIREAIDTILNDDSAWTQIVQEIGDAAIKSHDEDMEWQRKYDAAIADGVSPPDDIHEKTWHEIGQELKPEIIGWNWSEQSSLDKGKKETKP